jgi:hypothetical protein
LYIQLFSKSRDFYGKFHIPRKVGNSFLGQGTVFRHCPCVAAFISGFG